MPASTLPPRLDCKGEPYFIYPGTYVVNTVYTSAYFPSVQPCDDDEEGSPPENTAFAATVTDDPNSSLNPSSPVPEAHSREPPIMTYVDAHGSRFSHIGRDQYNINIYPSQGNLS